MSYLFAYGSLINANSRQRSLKSITKTIPCTVTGLKRTWGYKCPNRQYTALAVERNPQFITNGVLIYLNDPENDFKILDDREKHYARGKIPIQSVQTLDGSQLNGTIWVYEIYDPNRRNYSTQTDTPLYSHSPSSDCPIPQSYLDCCLKGCLSLGNQFAIDFINSTFGWSHWVNDRQWCLQHRKYIPKSEAGEYDCQETVLIVDNILMDTIPQYFRTRIGHLDCHSLSML